jgi:hypothetical protein
MSVQIIGYPLRKQAKLPCRILIEIDRNSLLSDLNVQKKELNVNKRKTQDMKNALQPDPMTTCANTSALKAL